MFNVHMYVEVYIIVICTYINALCEVLNAGVINL